MDVVSEGIKRRGFLAGILAAVQFIGDVMIITVEEFWVIWWVVAGFCMLFVIFDFFISV